MTEAGSITGDQTSTSSSSSHLLTSIMRTNSPAHWLPTVERFSRQMYFMNSHRLKTEIFFTKFTKHQEERYGLQQVWETTEGAAKLPTSLGSGDPFPQNLLWASVFGGREGGVGTTPLMTLLVARHAPPSHHHTHAHTIRTSSRTK